MHSCLYDVTENFYDVILHSNDIPWVWRHPWRPTPTPRSSCPAHEPAPRWPWLGMLGTTKWQSEDLKEWNQHRSSCKSERWCTYEWKATLFIQIIEQSHDLYINVFNSVLTTPSMPSEIHLKWSGFFSKTTVRFFFWYPSFLSIWCHDDVIKWTYFPRYWPFVRGIHRSPVISPHNGQ